MHDSGPVKLYNPYSVIKALESNKLSNFWVETGKINATIRKSELTNCTGWYTLLSLSLWRAGQGFRDNLNLLLMQKSVKLVVDEHVDYSRCLTILFSVARSSGLRPVTASMQSLIPVFGVSCILLVI